MSLHSRDLDKVSGLLWGLGTQGIEEQFLKPKKVRIKAYFDPHRTIRGLARRFKSQCQRVHLQLYALSSKTEIQRDWFKKWREQLKPFPVGNKFYVIPHKRVATPIVGNRIPIWLEPGMAFGTGTHETTRLCLEAIERYLVPNQLFLDIGTGSGILAIAAKKWGAAKVVACDIDLIALRIARSNAALNRCASKILFVLGEVQKVDKGPFDLLVANLTLEIIEESLEPMEKRLKPSGTLILSGILSSQLSPLQSRLQETSLVIQDRQRKGEWLCLALTR